MSTRNRTAHLGLDDTLADWEVGHLLAELRSGRLTGIRFDIVAVAESSDPITTMGGYRYIDERAVVDGDLITAGPQSPVPFACAAMRRLGLASERTLEAYGRLFDRGDASAFPVLAEAQSE